MDPGENIKILVGHWAMARINFEERLKFKVQLKKFERALMQKITWLPLGLS